MHRLVAIIVAVACSGLASSRAEPVLTPAVELVANLYRQFAWEALVEEPTKSTAAFIDQPKNVLERYFEPRLVALLLADRVCAKTTREVCKLDFSPLWASQDPGATALRVTATSRNEIVRVQFRYPGTGQQLVLLYEIVQSPVGLRIRDIQYESGSSLRTILEGK